VSPQKVPAEKWIEDDSTDEGILICSCPALLKTGKNFITYIQVFKFFKIEINSVKISRLLEHDKAMYSRLE
jgi:hypothetical protein